METQIAQEMRAAVSRALAEDVGSGDVTALLIAPESRSRATIISREAAVICGVAWVDEVFRQLDPEINISWQAGDGQRVAPNQRLVALQGRSRALLTGERTALNFLQTLSGTATLAARYAEAVAGLPVNVLDTRKTLPGLRLAQKYAVRCGGCYNHRVGLYDAILIKENHILAAGSIEQAVAQARQITPPLTVEIEVENLAEVAQALAVRADTLLLDNFTLTELQQAVALTQGRVKLEASGGVTLANIREIAATGVDFISVGGLTKDLHAIDLSMRFLPD